MKYKDIFSFSSRNLKLRPVRTMLTILGIIIGISIFIFFISLSEGIKQAALLETTKSYADTQIVVRPDYFKRGIFEVLEDDKVGLNEDTIRKFKTIPGIVAAYPQLTLKFPVSSRITMLGYTFETDSPVFGIPPEVFQDEPELYKAFTSKEDEVIPLLLNTHLLNIYNSSIAESNNLPRLTEAALIGAKIDVMLGYSTFMQSAMPQNKEATPGVIAGFSERVPLMGMSIPLATAEQFLKEYHADTNENGINYHSIYVIAEKMENIEAISEEIENMGFSTQSALKMVQNINNILNYFFLIFGVLTIIILIVAVGSIINTISMSVLSRVKEIGILRACGSTKRDVSLIFFTESMLMGFLGAFLGILFGVGVSVICNSYLLSIVPDVSYKPATFFAYPLWIFPAALGISLFISSLGGFFPSRRAANMDPIKALFS